MTIKQLLYMLSALLCGGLLATGCEADEQLKKHGNDLVEGPVEFSLISGGAKGADPLKDSLNFANPRPIYVDRVKVYVYQRPLGQQYATDQEGFQKSGEVKLVAHETGSAGALGQPRFKAYGKVQMKRGYEYRMTAIAYSEALREDTLFGLDNSFFSDAEVALKDPVEYRTPELFFGNVVYQDTDTIFQYENSVDEMMKLSGWLYRGVAGVELELEKVSKDVKRIELLADSIRTRVRACVYDDFHRGYGMQKDGKFEHFVLDSWNREEDKMDGNGTVELVGANLFEVCTSLSLRITQEGEGGVDKQVVCRLRLKDKTSSATAGVQRYALPGDGGNGTGIIPGGEQTPEEPEIPETARDPYKNCFKRNNYYKLSGDYIKLLTKDYVIQVVVNPNWDGDIYLPLDRTQSKY